MRTELRQALEQVASRIRQMRLWSALALCWLAWGAAGAGLSWWSARSGGTATDWRTLAGFAAIAAVTGAAAAALALRSARDRRWVARRIEAKHPELGTGLLAAVEEDADSPGRLGYLQATVIRHALDHRRTHDWESTVPNWKLRGTKLIHAAALAMLIVVSFGLAGQARSRGDRAVAEDGPTAPDGLTIEPGNAEIERGTPLLVVARFEGVVPADAALVVEGAANSTSRRTMTRSLEDPAFAGRVASVEADLSYRVEYGGRTSDTYKVTVFEYPDVVRTDAQLNFPSYTSLEPKTVEDVRHVTAVEGTELTLVCRLNKEVATARFVDEKGETIELTSVAGEAAAYQGTFTLVEPRRLRVELVDRNGRANKVPTEIAVNVVPNKPPVVAAARPARDVRVSPVEELSAAAKLEDDFGILRHGVSFTLAGSEPREVVLGESSPNARRLEAGHVLDFESFAAEPDQLVSYHFWAEDVGPDGEPRRSSGDMYFAEVRPFEEIFRQGEQPAGGPPPGQQGQQGGAQQALELAELQKEIINGTWKLIRRETRRAPTKEFAADAALLLEGQRSAIEQAKGLEAELQDPASKAELAAATKLMNDAVTHLTAASESQAIPSLQPALVAEQAAYQALLKLRDREFNIVRGQQQQGGRGGGGPSQAQLQQLELSNEENRYEQRRTAQQEQLSQQGQEQRETRQVLNRLRELARRQEDLNERLNELQSALEAAKDAEQREEIERQLKRLREQEQQILRDTDELRERMESEENRDRMAEARQQVEESRERVRQASEALEEGRVSQALTEGTRAERQLQELGDELRKETSNRFSEEMTGMRDEARRLDEAQEELSEQLESMNDGSRRSLRDGDERRQIGEAMEGQKRQLEELLERMRTTVQEAEEPEPMLAEKLFDTVRETERRSIDQALDAADRLADLGITEEAAKASRHAGEGLDQLREGVEAAAESVLGDETEALKRAQGELEDLAEQIDRELGEPADQAEAGQTEKVGAGSRGRGPGEAPELDDFRPPGADAPVGDGGNRGEQDTPPEGTAQDRTGAEEATADEASNDSQPDSPEKGGQPGQDGRPAQDGLPQEGQPGGGAQAGQRNEPSGQQGEQEGGQEGQQPGSQEGQQQQGGQEGDRPGGAGQQGGAPQEGQPSRGQAGGGESAGDAAPSEGGPRQPGGRNSLRNEPAGPRTPNGGARGGAEGGLDRLLDGGAGAPSPGGPITGEGFREWSDRMRDVEELIEDPDLSAEAARIRDRVRGAREEFKRHSKEPDPRALRTLVAEPLRELRDRVAEEVSRRESPDSLVPIDRDPVPPAYAEGVRRYYERLGTGR